MPLPSVAGDHLRGEANCRTGRRRNLVSYLDISPVTCALPGEESADDPPCGLRLATDPS